MIGTLLALALITAAVLFLIELRDEISRGLD